MTHAAAHNRRVTPRTWAVALLHSMGLPTSEGNITVIEEWEAREGGQWLNTARYNPLNTTQNAPGASSINSVGVKAYASWSEGLAATRQTLRNGLYDPVLAALKRKDDPAAVAAIRSSPWAGSGGYHTWVTPSSAHAYSQRTASGGPFVIHPEPFTLSALTTAVTPTTTKGSAMKKYVLLAVVLVVVVLIVKK